MTYRTSILAQWLARIEALHPSAIDMGLERVARVRDRLGIRFSCPILVVAGTNGKGSTCAMLEAITRAAGYRSPDSLKYGSVSGKTAKPGQGGRSAPP